MPAAPSPQDNEFPELPDDLNRFAERLAQFRPRTVSSDRDQLIYQAGIAAAGQERLATPSPILRELRLWKSVALLLTAVSAGLATTLAVRPIPQPRVVLIEKDGSGATAERSVSPAANPTTLNDPANDTNVPSESPHSSSRREVVTDSWESHQQFVEGFRTRRNLIAQIAQTGTPPEAQRETTAGGESPLPARPSQPPLTGRSLMMSVRSNNWINRLIEEPQL